MVQPHDVWGISWKLWLPAIVGDRAPEVHAAKQKAYAELLARGAARRLPGADLAEALLAVGHHVAFVTAASQASALAVLGWLKLEPNLLWGYELSSSERTQVLEDVALFYFSATSYIYVDDREEGATIAAKAGYGFVHARWTR